MKQISCGYVVLSIILMDPFCTTILFCELKSGLGFVVESDSFHELCLPGARGSLRFERLGKSRAIRAG